MRGICKLTLKEGSYVKSHIIPAVYTRPAIAGAHLMQGGGKGRPIKRWSSWYDPRLVISEGEAILGSYDDAAHKELSRLKLIWSSWGPMQALTARDHQSAGSSSPYGFRNIADCNTNVLRMFFLSLLWRAAATNLNEFDEISIGQLQLDELRKHVLEGNPGSPGFYAVNLIQLSTRGTVHNLAGLNGTKKIPTMIDGKPDFDNPSHTVDIYRFYLDGLIVHIHQNPEQDDKNPALLGSDETLAVLTITYEHSWQKEKF